MKKEINNYSLYRHTSPSGKVYIGITSQNVEHRWNHGRGYMNVKKGPFKSTIIKYGWDNIKHEVLFSDLTESLAKHLEIELIRHYKNLGISLNITDGGDGLTGCTPWNKGKKVPYEKSNKRKGCHLSEEHKRKLSLSHIGIAKGRKWTEKQKQALSLSLKGKLKGRIVPEETRYKIKEHSAEAKVVIEYDLQGNIIHKFKSASDAGREYGIDVSWVAKACRKKVMCSGHIFMFEDNLTNIKDIKPPHYREGISIKIINIKTGQSKIFSSKTECAKYLGYKSLTSLNKNISSGRLCKGDWKIVIDDLSDIMSFIRRNTKNNLQQQIED